VKNWIKIAMAFCWFVENRKRSILNLDKLTLGDVVRQAYSKKGEELAKYIEMRKKMFAGKSESSEYTRKENLTALMNKVEVVTE